jgi:hypothetical protein
VLATVAVEPAICCSAEVSAAGMVVVKDIGEAFTVVGKANSQSFLPLSVKISTMTTTVVV